MVKTLFIKLKKKVLLKDKIVILRDLFIGEGELIDLGINHDGNSNLGKNVILEEFINSLIISNYDFNPELLEINHYGIHWKVKFWELNLTQYMVNLIFKTFNKEYQSINTLFNSLRPKWINPQEPIT